MKKKRFTQSYAFWCLIGSLYFLASKMYFSIIVKASPLSNSNGVFLLINLYWFLKIVK